MLNDRFRRVVGQAACTRGQLSQRLLRLSGPVMSEMVIPRSVDTDRDTDRDTDVDVECDVTGDVE